MSRCVLFGHNWLTMKGAGQYRGAEFLVCQDCGRTEPVTTQEAAQAEERVSREGAKR